MTEPLAVGMKVRLTDVGARKQILRGFSLWAVENPVGEIVSIYDDRPPTIYYVVFDDVRRSDGKQRFGFVAGDMTEVIDDGRQDIEGAR